MPSRHLTPTGSPCKVSFASSVSYRHPCGHRVERVRLDHSTVGYARVAYGGTVPTGLSGKTSSAGCDLAPSRAPATHYREKVFESSE